MKEQKELWIGVLTALSCVSVIYLHVNNVFWKHPNGWLWISSNIIECLFYFAVPVFLMILGYTLLDYKTRYDTKTFIKKRIVRTVIPFLFWSVSFFFIYKKQNFFISFINCKIEGIYNFFPRLFACYFGIIFLSFIPNKKQLIKWLFLWSFLSYSIIPFLKRLFDFNISSIWQNPVGCDYLLFIFLGYILGCTQFSKKERESIYFLGGIGLLCHIVGTIWLTPHQGKINILFKGYPNWPCVLYSAAIFV